MNLSNNCISTLWELPKSLEQLILCNNSLSTLDGILISLSRLHTLDISNNYITSIYPLSSLAHLRCLYAANNRISSLAEIENCHCLLEIDLEDNFIHCTELEVFNKNNSICAVNFRNNPIYRYFLYSEISAKSLQVIGFNELQDGIFYRNIEKLKEIKSSKLRLIMKKSKKEEAAKGQRKRSSYSSRNTSMQEVYDQVINEDPEMEESLNSSESEERLAKNEEFVKKPSLSIAKLQLVKITEKATDKISCEK